MVVEVRTPGKLQGVVIMLAGQGWWHCGVRDEDSFDGSRNITLRVIKLDEL